jgi:hypothetical protein
VANSPLITVDDEAEDAAVLEGPSAELVPGVVPDLVFDDDGISELVHECVLDPIVIGVVSDLIGAVSETDGRDDSTTEAVPAAVRTVVAISDAVPQPNCE